MVRLSSLRQIDTLHTVRAKWRRRQFRRTEWHRYHPVCTSGLDDGRVAVVSGRWRQAVVVCATPRRTHLPVITHSASADRSSVVAGGPCVAGACPVARRSHRSDRFSLINPSGWRTVADLGAEAIGPLVTHLPFLLSLSLSLSLPLFILANNHEIDHLNLSIPFCPSLLRHCWFGYM